MSNWREEILKEFTPNVARLTLVADPDGLLMEEGIFAGIRARGFELIPFEDHIAFRYAYETKFRSQWNKGEQTELVVVLHSAASDLATLPYDLLQVGRQLSFSLSEIFPNLSYPVVTTLDQGDLDALDDAQRQHAHSVLGDNATIEFILRHVFDITLELIKKPSDLLRVLLRRHYRDQRIPSVLEERLVRLLHQQKGFENWHLNAIIPDRQAFFAFLQERWPIFLDQLVSQQGIGIRERKERYGLAFSGPEALPFDHADVRVYIDNLFFEGLLDVVPCERAEALSETWAAVGIQIDEQADRKRRVKGLLDTIASTIPDENARHDTWFHLARKWAELIALIQEPDAILPDPVHHSTTTLKAQIDATFESWLTNRYAGLSNLPPVPPVMLHHIPRFLSRHIQDAQEHKVALILVDGLSLDQWIVVRKELATQRLEYSFDENAVFAWIPTITAVSRQTAFAGKPPIYFPDSINTTNKEPALWTQFWMDEGLKQQEVGYTKGLGDGALDDVKEIIDQPQMRVVGLVVDTVDSIMHGMQLGTAGMHNQVRQWAAQPFMVNLIDLLLDNGFRVLLSSDHGNIEATGCGQPSEGAVAALRGGRVRVYPNSTLRDQVKTRFPTAIEWPLYGLPEDYLPLLAPGRTAFVRKGERLVGHGGSALEELIVPLVQIDRRYG